MTSWTRVHVCFTSLVDTCVNEIKYVVSETYPLSYVGKYVHEGKSHIYLQTSSNKVRMVPNKVRMSLSSYGDITFIGKFESIEGMMDDEVGEMRTRNRRSHGRGEHVNTEKTCGIINGGHNTLTDNSVTINLHIHAFGKEDLTHITQDQLDHWIGKKDDVLRYAKSEVEDYKMDALRYKVYCDQYKEREKEWESIPGSAKPQFLNEEDSPHELEIEECLIKELIEEYGKVHKNTIVTDFAKVLYDNPHNANVSINHKNGNFKIFDGRKWSQYEMPRLCEFILENLRRKVREALDHLNLNEKKFTRGFIEYIDFIWDDDEKFKDNRLVRKRLANAVQAAVDNEISSIRDHFGKKIRRVNGCDVKGSPRAILYENSWGDLRETLKS